MSRAMDRRVKLGSNVEQDDALFFMEENLAKCWMYHAPNKKSCLSLTPRNQNLRHVPTKAETHRSVASLEGTLRWYFPVVIHADPGLR
jgi:hypothetical protein